jgi:FtsP/CotA-like multicopper oxidase with cupredoxin domain
VSYHTIKLNFGRQLNSPWSDGVPGLSQVAIESGCTFTYRWKATQYGTYWYHGHRQGHLEDGLFGAINIKFVVPIPFVRSPINIYRPLDGTPTPFNMITNDTNALHSLSRALIDSETVLLSDWSHFTSEELRNISIAANIDPL